jgi:hypothetical protein
MSGEIIFERRTKKYLRIHWDKTIVGTAENISPFSDRYLPLL